MQHHVRRVLAEHRALQGELAELRRRALSLFDSEPAAISGLLPQIETFLDRLRAHSGFERDEVVPLLRARGTKGEEQAGVLELHHALQERAMAELREACAREDPMFLAHALLTLVGRLQEGMHAEEEALQPHLESRSGPSPQGPGAK